MAGKGRTCRTIQDRRCTLALDGSRRPIVLCRCCKSCGEWRCRRHCKCGRSGKHAPRRNPRSVKKSAKTTRAAAKTVAPVLPVARCVPAALRLEVLQGEAWFASMHRETRSARSWWCASYVFDDPATKSLLLQRLRGGVPFDCRIVVDKDVYLSKSSRGQAACLRELQAAGAKVFLAHGRVDAARRVFGPTAKAGSVHVKAVAIDGQVVYSGGANCTRQARCNRELVYRIVGPPVADIVAEITATMTAGTPLGRR